MGVSLILLELAHDLQVLRLMKSEAMNTMFYSGLRDFEAQQGPHCLVLFKRGFYNKSYPSAVVLSFGFACRFVPSFGFAYYSGPSRSVTFQPHSVDEYSGVSFTASE